MILRARGTTMDAAAGTATRPHGHGAHHADDAAGGSVATLDVVVRPPARHRASRGFPWLGVTVAATAAAGGLHVAAAATHSTSGDLVVGFFGLTALVQLATAATVFVVLVGEGRRRSPRGGLATLLLLGAAAMTVGLLCLYVVVHGTDLLAGPLERAAAGASSVAGHAHAASDAAGHIGVASSTTTAGAHEPVDALGTTTAVVELLALTGFLALLPGWIRRRATDVLLVLGVLGWALWLTGALD
jgi:hypothetical protein